MRTARLSLLTRITGGSLLIAVLISAAAGIVLYEQVRRIVFEGEEAVLAGIEAPYRTALVDEPADPLDRPGDGQLVAVVDPSGVPRLDTLPAGIDGMLPELLDGAGRARQVSSGGSSYLLRVSPVRAPAGTWHIVSASDTAAQSAVLAQVGALLVVSIVVLNLGYGAASWLIGTAALRPVSRMRTTAEKLVASGSTELLPVGSAQDEIARLAHTMNELITHLRASAARERQIVSDASHELRTPLAVLQTQLELAQAEDASLDQMRRDVSAAQNSVARLSGLATALLALSRIDAQVVRGSASVEALAGELADAVDRARATVGARAVDIDFEAEVTDPEARVSVAASDFGRVVDNLVSNARAAVGVRGHIEVRLEQDRGGVVLSVSDDGGGMDEEFLPHATERFARADTSRGGSGAGLGLAIVSGIVSVAGGTLEFRNRPGTGLTVLVALPSAAPPPPA
jgi:two-component system OmpR family sensor kinase